MLIPITLHCSPDWGESCLRARVYLLFSGDNAAMLLAAGILRDISAALPKKQRQLMADARVSQPWLRFSLFAI